MSKKTSPEIPCESCNAKVHVVFLADGHEPVFTPVIHKDQVILAIVGTECFPFPNASHLVSESPRWLCEKCMRDLNEKAEN